MSLLMSMNKMRNLENELLQIVIIEFFTLSSGFSKINGKYSEFGVVFLLKLGITFEISKM